MKYDILNRGPQRRVPQLVKAGCRYFTLAQAEAHWKETRGGTALFRETEIIFRAMVDLAYARGLMKAPVREAAE